MPIPILTLLFVDKAIEARIKKEPVHEQDEYESSDEESYYEEDDTADEDYKP